MPLLVDALAVLEMQGLPEAAAVEFANLGQLASPCKSTRPLVRDIAKAVLPKRLHDLQPCERARMSWYAAKLQCHWT